VLELTEIGANRLDRSARVDRLVNKRTKASSTTPEKFSGDPGVIGGGGMRKRLRNSLLLWFKSIKPTMDSRGAGRRAAAPRARAFARDDVGSKPAPRQTAVQADVVIAVVECGTRRARRGRGGHLGLGASVLGPSL